LKSRYELFSHHFFDVSRLEIFPVKLVQIWNRNPNLQF